MMIQNYSPARRKGNFFDNLDINRLIGDLSPGLLGALAIGDQFTSLQPATVEPLQISVQREQIERITHWNKAYFGLVARNMIQPGDAWREREVVVTVSEPHGGVMFIHDADTGALLSPSDTTGMHAGKGDEVAILQDLFTRVDTPNRR